jgi:tetratricopeptide (TPR) repeat protein
LARANAAWSQRRLPEALAAARRAAALAPGTLTPVLSHARVAEALGEFDEAADAYARATRIAPDDMALVFSRASFAYRSGDDAAAAAALDRVIALHPWRARLLYTYGPARVQPWLLRDNRMLSEVVQLRVDMTMERGDLERAREIARTYGIVQEGRSYCGEAQTAMRSKEPTPEVLRDLRLAVLGEPNNYQCVWWLGQTVTDEGYVRLGLALMAETARMAADQPSHHQAALRYVRVRLGGGREVPKRAEQLFIIGRQRYLRDRDADGATRLLTEAVRLAPHFARPYSYLSRIAWDRGDREGAVAWLQRAVEADPESWRTHRNLGKMLDAVARMAAAETHLRKAVELLDDDVGGRFALARVLYARSKFPEYVEQTQRAVSAARSRKTEVQEVSAFLAGYHIAGAGRTLPPAPDPPLVRGWLYD